MKRSLSVAALALALGCGSSKVLLSARAGQPVAQAAQSGLLAQRPQLQVSGGVVIDRIRIVLREVELVPADGGADADQTVVGPVLLDLSGAALDGGVQPIVAGYIDAGSFNQIDVTIGPVTADEEEDDAGLVEMAALGASIRIDGTIGGNEFSFTSSLEAEQHFQHGATVGDHDENLTLNLDPTSWFSLPAGVQLDLSDPSVRAQIEANILASMNVFQDNNLDGLAD